MEGKEKIETSPNGYFCNVGNCLYNKTVMRGLLNKNLLCLYRPGKTAAGVVEMSGEVDADPNTNLYS